MFTCNQKCIYSTSLHKLPGKLFKWEKNPQKEYLHGFNDLVCLHTGSYLVNPILASHIGKKYRKKYVSPQDTC